MGNLKSTQQSVTELLSASLKTSYSNIQELHEILSTERSIFKQVLACPADSLSNDIVGEIRLRFIGKKSPLQELLKSLKNLAPDERKQAGAIINELKTFLEIELNVFIAAYQTIAENLKLQQEAVDISLPLPEITLGTRHPVQETMELLINSLKKLGFIVVDGPEIEHDFYNFTALNQPEDHPAREMQDTMFISTEWLLRSHTSNVQAHALIERGAPLRIICPGFVYRRDYDMTHSPCFRQLECLVVDKGINMGHLRSTINAFIKDIFGKSVKTRFRSSYFPFTEPSAELDIECQQCMGQGCRSCKNTGWMELGGCGMVNKNVFTACNIDPNIYSGFAFGFGVDRIAMNRYGIADLRTLFEGDVAQAQAWRAI